MCYNIHANKILNHNNKSFRRRENEEVGGCYVNWGLQFIKPVNRGGAGTFLGRVAQNILRLI